MKSGEHGKILQLFQWNHTDHHHRRRNRSPGWLELSTTAVAAGERCKTAEELQQEQNMTVAAEERCKIAEERCKIAEELQQGQSRTAAEVRCMIAEELLLERCTTAVAQRQGPSKTAGVLVVQGQSRIAELPGQLGQSKTVERAR
jgi:hypothetical protein